MRLVLLQTTPGFFIVVDKRDESRCVSRAGVSNSFQFRGDFRQI